MGYDRDYIQGNRYNIIKARNRQENSNKRTKHRNTLNRLDGPERHRQRPLWPRAIVAPGKASTGLEAYIR